MLTAIFHKEAVKAAVAKKTLIRIAVVESDPVRLLGFRAVFDSERDFELISSSLSDVGTQQNIDLVLLLGNRRGQNLLDVMTSLKAAHPHLCVVVVGSGMDNETILKAIVFGAKGYLDMAASPADFGVRNLDWTFARRRELVRPRASGTRLNPECKCSHDLCDSVAEILAFRARVCGTIS